MKPTTQQAYFIEDTVKCSPKEGATLKLYVNPPLATPRIVVQNQSINGRFDGDKHNVIFEMKEIKRKGQYEAVLYDGSKKIATLSFKTERGTKSNDRLGI